MSFRDTQPILGRSTPNGIMDFATRTENFNKVYVADGEGGIKAVDPIETFGLLVDGQNSIVKDTITGKLNLVEDLEDPGAGKVYGTDALGNKCWREPKQLEEATYLGLRESSLGIL